MVNHLSKITHLFLDLDGTLVNSLPRLQHIYFDFLQEYQKEGSSEEFSSLKTSSLEKLIDYFKMKYVLTPPVHDLKEQFKRYLEKYYFRAPLFSGVEIFLKQAAEMDLKLVLTTANQKDQALKLLKFHKIDKYFQDIYTPKCFDFDTKNAFFYESVVEKLGINREKILVIDDSLEAVASSLEIGLQAFFFSKISYHPIPSFGNWKILSKLWLRYAAR